MTARPRVCMFVINAFTHDARVTREAATLARSGYDVTVLAVRRNPSLPAREERDGFVVERLDLGRGPLGALRRVLSKRPGRSASDQDAREQGGAEGGAPAGVRGARGGHGVRAYLAPVTRTISAAQYCLAAARRARQLAPDILHCHDFHTLPAGLLARRRSGGRRTPMIYDSHELWAHLNIEHPTMPRLRRIVIERTEALMARRCDAVITVSEAFADHLAARLRVARPTVLLNVPDVASAAPHPVPESLRGTEPVLLYVGGIQRNRGLERCVNALASIPGARLVLMGPAVESEAASLTALAEAAGVADRVVFEPPIPATSVPAIASHAAVGLVPFQNTCLSHYLTLPNKLFESIHAGIPVVASDFPEFRRIVEGEDVGICCDTSDPGAIAAAVGKILGDPELARRYRDNAAAAAGRFTWEVESAKLVSLYSRLP